MAGLDTQKLNEAMALISIAGFATQRAIELLDPLLATGTSLLAALARGINRTFYKPKDESGGAAGAASAPAAAALPFGLTETGLKTWLVGVASFVIGLIIAGQAQVKLLEASDGLNQFVIALAISLGTNGFNSLLKYVEFAKEARKAEVKPLPVITITPAPVTVRPSAKIQFLASVTGMDNREVKWKLLEPESGGTIEETTGIYTAPSAAGTYHIAAISLANEASSASATITVS
jgi:hypothetical protein